MSKTAVRSFQPSQLRGVNRDNRTVDIVASSFAIDSYGTRLDPSGWDLEQFKKNPVICLQHDSYRGLPVASAIPESIRVENGKLVMTVQFPPEGTSANADEAFNLIAAGVLRGVSVGFDPSESEQATEQTQDGGKVNVLIYRKQRLLEVSFVTIPSNDDGLVVRARELNADPDTIRKQTEHLEAGLKEAEPDELAKYTRDHLLVCVGYFERKQPANKAATHVLAKFFKARNVEQPADEVEAWERMGELMDETPTEQVEEKAEETPAEAPAEQEKVEAVEPTPPEAAPTTPTPPVPAAPEPERTASVQVPLTLLAELPGKMARAYVETAVAALQRGTPRKDVAKIIDGANDSVTKSLSTFTTYGAH